MNKERVYDTQIAPLMQQIIGVCKEHSIPMLAQFHVPNDVDPELLCATILMADSFEPPPHMVRLARYFRATQMQPEAIRSLDEVQRLREGILALLGRLVQSMIYRCPPGSRGRVSQEQRMNRPEPGDFVAILMTVVQDELVTMGRLVSVEPPLGGDPYDQHAFTRVFTVDGMDGNRAGWSNVRCVALPVGDPFSLDDVSGQFHMPGDLVERLCVVQSNVQGCSPTARPDGIGGRRLHAERCSRPGCTLAGGHLERHLIDPSRIGADIEALECRYLLWLIDEPQALSDLTHTMILDAASTHGHLDRERLEQVITTLPAGLRNYVRAVVFDASDVPELSDTEALELLEALFAGHTDRGEFLAWHERRLGWQHMPADWVDAVMQLKGWAVLRDDEDEDDDG